LIDPNSNNNRDFPNNQFPETEFPKSNFQNIVSKTEFVMLVVVPLEACFGVKPTARRQGAELASGK
jgi:hypothetical protein